MRLMSDCLHYIPIDMLSFARNLAPCFTPNKRASGFADPTESKRGRGDYLDLLGTLLIFDIMAHENIVSRAQLVSGAGDDCDLMMRHQQDWVTINVKTSEFAPFHDGLNLFIKQEEIAKPIDAYVQVFVHTSEDDAPHVHLAGWATTRGPQFKKRMDNLIEIPNTGGHKGIAIPVRELRPFASLLKLGDRKF
jgi:hypothetical protein